ncbi:hypothetical protein [Cryobacterium sp. PH29-G1]|uniref:hypothetical protein n=1 Tax=Cryobacterium sp. PH29-G1 TaxID=3046211 RepID=UPI0024B97B1E|nr:hypothetical protein [Cryobacterium sp. PH29-G1]MDJ0348931.1 hypothetical protein [Cryobacterium sp. PH29-G1]
MATTPGDDPGFFGDLVGGIGNAINGAAGVVSYWSDPWGNSFKMLRDTATGMSRDIMPALTSATLPDLTTDWFINAYKISFATAIFVAVLLLIPQAVRTARGAQAGRDLVESVGLYFGTFLIGAMFGPMFGIMLINFFHSLTDVFVAAGLTGTATTVTGQFSSMIEQADPVGITGGIVMGVILMICMIFALFLVLLMLLVQLVTLYFTGVLLPLGLVWIIDKNKRSFGLKIAALWIGILAAHPLLFLLLGLAFSMTANQLSAFGNNFGLQSMVSLLVAIIGLLMAALSPLLLMKFAPIIPMAFGGTTGPSVDVGKHIGAQNMTEASERYGQPSNQDRSSSTTTRESTDSTTERVSESSTAPGSLSEVIGNRAAAAAAGTGAAGEGATIGAGRTATATAGAAGAGAAAGGGAAAAETGLAAAGTAESATGAGAVVGVPTLIAAAGIAAAHKGVEVVGKGVDMAQTAGEQVTESMDDTPTLGGDRP